MAKREISIVLRARNAMVAGIASAKRALSSMAGFVSGLSRRIAYGFAAGTAAIVAFGTVAMRAYAQSEAAEKALASALRVHGDAVDDLIPKLKKVAAAIQDETGVEDDATIAGMAHMRMLGVQADELEAASRAAIALKSANIEGESAQKAVAMAIAGQYKALSRVMPALRTATSEAEKARVVNDFLTAGYQQQRDMLKTSGGAWAALKVDIGNALENIGEAINKNQAIARVLNVASSAVKRFGEMVKSYVDSAEFARIQKSIEGIVGAMSRGGADRAEVMEAFGGAIRASFALAALEAVEILKKAAGEIGSLIGAGIKRSAKETGKNIPSVLNAAANPMAIPATMWRKVFDSWRGKEKTPEGAPESIQMTNAKKRFSESLSALESLGTDSAAKMGERIADASASVPPIKIDIAGAGVAEAAAGISEEVGRSMSSMMDKTLEKFRQMGHDVEELGIGARASKAQQQAREHAAQDRQMLIMEQSLGVEEEMRDLLRENLKAP